MNSKLILLLLCLQSSITINAQNLSKDVRQDFCKNAVLNYEYGTNMFKAWMNQSARAIGIQTPYEIEEAVQNIATNQKLQEEFFKNVNRLGGNKDFKIQQFTSIGMTVQHAKLLVDYIYLKYSVVTTSKVQKDVEDESEEELIVVKKQSDTTIAKLNTTPCKVYKKEAWIYNKNSFKNTAESQKSRITKLTKGTLIDVVIDWEEEPKQMVKVIYTDMRGKKRIGFMLTSAVEFLNAG